MVKMKKTQKSNKLTIFINTGMYPEPCVRPPPRSPGLIYNIYICILSYQLTIFPYYDNFFKFFQLDHIILFTIFLKAVFLVSEKQPLVGGSGLRNKKISAR